MNHTWHEKDNAKNDVDKKIFAQSFFQPHSNWGQENSKDDDEDFIVQEKFIRE